MHSSITGQPTQFFVTRELRVKSTQINNLRYHEEVIAGPFVAAAEAETTQAELTAQLPMTLKDYRDLLERYDSLREEQQEEILIWEPMQNPLADSGWFSNYHLRWQRHQPIQIGDEWFRPSIIRDLLLVALYERRPESFPNHERLSSMLWRIVNRQDMSDMVNWNGGIVLVSKITLTSQGWEVIKALIEKAESLVPNDATFQQELHSLSGQWFATRHTEGPVKGHPSFYDWSGRNWHGVYGWVAYPAGSEVLLSYIK